MSKTEFIVIRHGYSEANEQQIFAGNYNIHLTELGKRQASVTAQYLNDIHIDKIYSSDLFRAYETAEPIAEIKGLPIIKSKALREISAGDWEGRKFDDIDAEFRDDYDVWRNDLGRARCTNGESTAELYTRISEEFARIACESENQTVCVVTHATPIRAMNCFWSGKSAEYMSEMKFAPNASVTRVIYDGDNMEIIEYGYSKHLGEMKTELPANV